MRKNDFIIDPHIAAAELGLSKDAIEGIDGVCDHYKFMTSVYYLNLAKTSDAIKKQLFPDRHELRTISEDNRDYLKEEQFRVLHGLIHKYPYCALITATENCFMLCRHCTRKRFQENNSQKNNSHEKIDYIKIFDYIANNTQITDVLITGGDPLTLSDASLAYILDGLNEIRSIKTMRIGTRAPVTYPMRITKHLVKVLSKYKNLWLNTQFNHPDEVTLQSRLACSLLIDAGIPVNNQTVMLKNINDNVKTLKELFLSLISMRVRPYYLYQCDYGNGITHFITDIKKSIEIYDHLRGTIPGYAIPQLIIDTPTAKIPLSTAEIHYVSEKIAEIVFHDKTIVIPRL